MDNGDRKPREVPQTRFHIKRQSAGTTYTLLATWPISNPWPSSNIKLVATQPGTTAVSGGGGGNHHPGVVVLVEVDRVVVQCPRSSGANTSGKTKKRVDRGGGDTLGRVHEKWVAGSLLHKGLHRRSPMEGGN